MHDHCPINQPRRNDIILNERDKYSSFSNRIEIKLKLIKLKLKKRKKEYLRSEKDRIIRKIF